MPTRLLHPHERGILHGQPGALITNMRACGIGTSKLLRPISCSAPWKKWLDARGRKSNHPGPVARTATRNTTACQWVNSVEKLAIDWCTCFTMRNCRNLCSASDSVVNRGCGAFAAAMCSSCSGGTATTRCVRFPSDGGCLPHKMQPWPRQ